MSEDTNLLIREVDNNIVKEVKKSEASEINQWFKDNIDADYKDPYKPDTRVTEIECLENITLVRVYDNTPGGSGMLGSWLMQESDIEGMTAAEIKDKYALPSIPRFICDVTVPKGAHLRMGVANSLPEWGIGGGLQFDLMGQRIGEFKNERRL